MLSADVRSLTGCREFASATDSLFLESAVAWRHGNLSPTEPVVHTMGRQSLVISGTCAAPSQPKTITTMEDSNVIAYFFALHHSKAEDVICMRQNSGRYIPPRQELQSEHDSRESTVSDDDEEKDPTRHSRLQLTFNPGPKASRGFMIGTDENCCDIVLPKGGISRRHCCLTFDEKRRLILRDLSSNGTMVTYDGQGGEKRKTVVTKDKEDRQKFHHFTWILSDVELNEVKEIVVTIEGIEFIIIIPNRQTHSVLYNNNVDRFLQEANADNDLPFGTLGMQSTTSTVQYNRTDTLTIQEPILKPIYIRRAWLGSGKFSVVNRVWNVSSGSVYASKEFVNMKESAWKKEASIMSQISRLSNVNLSRFPKIIC